MKKTPMYQNVYRLIVKRIESGFYSVEDLLPSEPELQQEFQVSRTTVRKAMEMLSRDGYITIKQGRGTRVNDRHEMSQLLNYVSSFSETLRKRGCEVSVRGAEFALTKADESMAKSLDVGVGEKLYYLYREILADGAPIAIAKNYLIPHFVPGLPQDYQDITSLYQYLENRWGISIESAFDRITARAATEEEARTLELNVGDPLLIDKRVTQTMGVPFEAVTLVIDAKSYEFGIYTKERLS